MPRHSKFGEWQCNHCTMAWGGKDAERKARDHEKQDHRTTLEDILEALDSWTVMTQSAICNLVKPELIDDVAKERVVELVERGDELRDVIRRYS